MPDRLPPLAALRAFETAARQLNFSRAAEELYITHSAVSHQIKALETHLGVKLFRRSARAMLLTSEGQQLYTHVREAFARLQRGVAELRPEARRGTLTVSVLPGFAARWLVPRLPEFYLRHPRLDVNLRATTRLTDFRREDVDLAVRFGPGSWPGLIAEKLLDEEIFPVCSPRYRGGKLPRSAEELLECTLLHHVYEPWEEWFRTVGLKTAAVPRGPGFSESNLLLKAAMEGQGVALALGVLVQSELKSGELKQCLPSLKARYAYYLVHPQQDPLPPKVEAFKAWLKEVARSAKPRR
jgi:LysR family transcriptional regulator, glycine cleavage system transcriptional activator